MEAENERKEKAAAEKEACHTAAATAAATAAETATTASSNISSVASPFRPFPPLLPQPLPPLPPLPHFLPTLLTAPHTPFPFGPCQVPCSRRCARHCCRALARCRWCPHHTPACAPASAPGTIPFRPRKFLLPWRTPHRYLAHACPNPLVAALCACRPVAGPRGYGRHTAVRTYSFVHRTTVSGFKNWYLNYGTTLPARILHPLPLVPFPYAMQHP